MADETGAGDSLVEDIGINLSVNEADSFASSLKTTDAALDGLTKSLNSLITVIPSANEKFARLAEVFQTIERSLANSATGTKRLDTLVGALDRLSKMPAITTKVADGVKVAVGSILEMADAMAKVDAQVRNFSRTATTGTGKIKQNVAATKAAAQGTVSPRFKRAVTDTTADVLKLEKKSAGTWSPAKTATELQRELTRVTDEFAAAGDASAAALKGKISTQFATVLIDAVKKGESGAHEAGFSLGAAIEDGLKAALGIHSPSTVAVATAENLTNAIVTTLHGEAGKLETGGQFVGNQIKQGMIKALTDGEIAKVISESFEYGGIGNKGKKAARQVQSEISPTEIASELNKSMIAALSAEGNVVPQSVKNAIRNFADKNAQAIAETLLMTLTGEQWDEPKQAKTGKVSAPGTTKRPGERALGGKSEGPPMTLADAQAGLDRLRDMDEKAIKAELNLWSRRRAGDKTSLAEDLAATVAYYENTADVSQKAALAKLNESMQGVVTTAGGIEALSKGLQRLSLGLQASVTGGKANLDDKGGSSLKRLMEVARDVREGRTTAAASAADVAKHGPALIKALSGPDARPIYSLDLEAATVGKGTKDAESRIMQIGLTKLDRETGKIERLMSVKPQVEGANLDAFIAKLGNESWFKNDMTTEQQAAYVAELRAGTANAKSLADALRELEGHLAADPNALLTGHNVGQFDIGQVLKQQNVAVPASTQVVDTFDLAHLFSQGDVGTNTRTLGALFGQVAAINPAAVKMLTDRGFGEVTKDAVRGDVFQIAQFHDATNDAAAALALLMASVDAFAASILTAQAVVESGRDANRFKKQDVGDAQARLAILARQQQDEATAPASPMAAAVASARPVAAAVAKEAQATAAGFLADKLPPNFGASLAEFSNQDLEMLGQYKAYRGLLKFVRNRDLSGMDSAVQDAALRFILEGGSVEDTQKLIQKNMGSFTEDQAKFAARNLMDLADLSGVKGAAAKVPSTASTKLSRAMEKSTTSFEQYLVEGLLANVEPQLKPAGRDIPKLTEVSTSRAVRGMRQGRAGNYNFASDAYQAAMDNVMAERGTGVVGQEDFVRNMAQVAPKDLAKLYSPIRDVLPSSSGLPRVTENFAEELGTTVDRATEEAMKIANAAFLEIGIDVNALVDETLAQTKIINASDVTKDDRNAAKARIKEVWGAARASLNENMGDVTRAMTQIAPSLSGMSGEEMKSFAQDLLKYRSRQAAKSDEGPGFETLRTGEMDRLSEIMRTPGDLNARIDAIAKFDGALRMGYSQRVAALKTAGDTEGAQAWQVLSSRGGPEKLLALDELQQRFERRQAEVRSLPAGDERRNQKWAELELVQQDIDKILNSDVLMRRYKDYGDIIQGLKQSALDEVSGTVTPAAQAQIDELEGFRRNIERIDQIADPVLNAVARQQFDLRSRASAVEDKTIDERIQEMRAWETRVKERFGGFRGFVEAVARYEEAGATVVKRIQPFLDDNTLGDAMGIQAGYTKATKGVSALGAQFKADEAKKQAYYGYMRSAGGGKMPNLTKEQRAERRANLETVRGSWMEKNGLYGAYADMRGGASAYGVNKGAYERQFIGAGARTQRSSDEQRYVPGGPSATYRAKAQLEKQRALLEDKVSGKTGFDKRIFDVTEDASLTEEMRKTALEALEAKRSRTVQEIARIAALIGSIGRETATGAQVAEMAQRTTAEVRKGLGELRSYAAQAGGENVSGSVLRDEPTVLEVVLYARKLWANRLRDLDAEVAATVKALRSTDSPVDAAMSAQLTQRLADLQAERTNVPLGIGRQGDTEGAYIREAYERLAIKRAQRVQSQIPVVTQRKAITTKKREELGASAEFLEQRIKEADAAIIGIVPGPELDGMIARRLELYDQLAEIDARLASGYRTPTAQLKMGKIMSGAWKSVGTGKVADVEKALALGKSRSERGQGNISTLDSLDTFVQDPTKILSDEQRRALLSEKAALFRQAIPLVRGRKASGEATPDELRQWTESISAIRARMAEIMATLHEDARQQSKDALVWQSKIMPAAAEFDRTSPPEAQRQSAMNSLRILGHRRDALSKNLDGAAEADKDLIEKDIAALDKLIARSQARLDSAKRTLKTKREGVTDLDTSKGEGPTSGLLKRLSDTAWETRPQGIDARMSGKIAGAVASIAAAGKGNAPADIMTELLGIVNVDINKMVSGIADPAEQQRVAGFLNDRLRAWIKGVLAEAAKMAGGQEFLQADEVAAAKVARAAAARATLAGKLPGQGVAALQTGGAIDFAKTAEQANLLRQSLGTGVNIKDIFKRSGNKQTGYTYAQREVSAIKDEGQVASAAFEQSKAALEMFLTNASDIIDATSAALTAKGITGAKLDKILAPLRQVRDMSASIEKDLAVYSVSMEHGADVKTANAYVRAVTGNIDLIDASLTMANTAMRRAEAKAQAKAAAAVAPPPPPPVNPAATAAAGAAGRPTPATVAAPSVAAVVAAAQQAAGNTAAGVAQGVADNIATAAGNAAPPGLCPCTASIGDAATKIVDALRNLKVSGGTGGARAPRAARPEEDLDALRTTVSQRAEAVLRRQIEAGARTLNTVQTGAPVGPDDAMVAEFAKERNERVAAAKAAIAGGQSRVAILDAEKAAYASMMTYVDENIRKERLLTGVIVEANDHIEMRANITGDAMRQIDAILVSAMGHLRQSGIAPEQIRESTAAFEQLAQAARDAVSTESVSPDRTNQSLRTFAGNQVGDLRDARNKLVSVLRAEDERPLIRLGTEIIRDRGGMMRQLQAEIAKIQRAGLDPAALSGVLAPLEQQLVKVTTEFDAVGLAAQDAMGETGQATDVARQRIAILNDETRNLIFAQREQAKAAQPQGSTGFDSRTVKQIESFRNKLDEADRRVADMRGTSSPNLAGAEQIQRQMQALRAQADAAIVAAEALPGEKVDRWVAVNAALKPAIHTFAQLKQQLDAIAPSMENVTADLDRLYKVGMDASSRVGAAYDPLLKTVSGAGFGAGEQEEWMAKIGARYGADLGNIDRLTGKAATAARSGDASLLKDLMRQIKTAESMAGDAAEALGVEIDKRLGIGLEKSKDAKTVVGKLLRDLSFYEGYVGKPAEYNRYLEEQGALSGNKMARFSLTVQKYVAQFRVELERLDYLFLRLPRTIVGVVQESMARITALANTARAAFERLQNVAKAGASAIGAPFRAAAATVATVKTNVAQTGAAISATGGKIKERVLSLVPFRRAGAKAGAAGTTQATQAAQLTPQTAKMQVTPEVTFDRRAEAAARQKTGGFLSRVASGIPQGVGIGIGQALVNGIIHGIRNMMWGLQYAVQNVIRQSFQGVMDVERLRMTLASLSAKELSTVYEEQTPEQMFTAAGKGGIAIAEFSNNLDDVNNRWRLANKLADEQFQWLTKIARYSSFGRTAIAEGYAGLRNMGFTEINARAIETAGVMYADAFSPGNKEMIGTISTQLGQLFQTGVLKMEDLKPLSQTAMVDVRGYIANALFKDLWMTDKEEAKKKVAQALTKGEIGATEAVQAIIEGMTADAQAMSGKAASTLEGMFSTLEDIRQDTIGGLMRPLSDEMLKPFLELAINIGNSDETLATIDGIGTKIKEFSQGAINNLAIAAGTLSAAWGAVPWEFKYFLEVILQTGPALMALTLGVKGLGLAFGFLSGMFGGASAAWILLNAVIGGLAVAIRINLGGINDAVQNTFGGVILMAQGAIDWIRQLIVAIADVGEQRSLQVPAQGPPTQEESTRQGAANSFGGWQDFVEQDVNDLASLIDAPMTALAQFLQWVADNFDAMSAAIATTVSSWLDTLGGFIDGAITTLMRLPEALATIAGYMIDWGSNIVNMLAQGMTAAVQTIVNALAVIGQVIGDWLMPGSPPKLLPDLDKWGKGAADAYLEGWTLADFSVMKDLSSKIEEMLAADEGKLEPPQIQRIREAVAQYVDSITAGMPDLTAITNAIRSIDKSGSVAEELLRIAKAMGDLLAITRQLETAQYDLDLITARYEARLRPLQNRLEAIQKAQQDTDLVDQLVEYQRVLDNPYATKKQKDAAKLKLEELGIQKEISGLEEEREKLTDPLENQIAALQEQKLINERILAITEARFGVETDMMSVWAQVADAANGAADASEKAAEAAKEAAEKNLQFKQPDLTVPEIKVPEGFGEIQGKFIAFQEGLKASWDEMTKSAEKLTEPLGLLGDKFTGLHEALQKGYADGTFAPGNTTEGFIQNVGAAAKIAKDNVDGLVGAAQTAWQQFQTGFQQDQAGDPVQIAQAGGAPKSAPNLFDRFAAGLDATGLIAKAQLEIGKFQTWLNTAVDWPKLQADLQIEIDKALKLVSPDSVAKLANTIVDKLVEALNIITIPNEKLEQFKQNVAKGLGGVEFSGDDIGNLGKAMSIGLAAFFSAGPLVGVGTAIAGAISATMAVGGAAFGALAGIGGLIVAGIATAMVGGSVLSDAASSLAGGDGLASVLGDMGKEFQSTADSFSSIGNNLILWVADEINKIDWFASAAAAGASIAVGGNNMVIWIANVIKDLKLNDLAISAGEAAGAAILGAIAAAIFDGVYLGLKSDAVNAAKRDAMDTINASFGQFMVSLIWGIVRTAMEKLNVPDAIIDQMEGAGAGLQKFTLPDKVQKNLDTLRELGDTFTGGGPFSAFRLGLGAAGSAATNSGSFLGLDVSQAEMDASLEAVWSGLQGKGFTAKIKTEVDMEVVRAQAAQAAQVQTTTMQAAISATPIKPPLMDQAALDALYAKAAMGASAAYSTAYDVAAKPIGPKLKPVGEWEGIAEWKSFATPPVDEVAMGENVVALSKRTLSKMAAPFATTDPEIAASINATGLSYAKALAGGMSGNIETGGVSPLATSYAAMRTASTTNLTALTLGATTFSTNLQLVWTTLSQALQKTQLGLNEALSLGWTTMIEDANTQVDEWQANWVEEKWPTWIEAMLLLADTLKLGFAERINAMITEAQAAMDAFLAWLTNEDRLKAYSDAGYAIGEAIVGGILFAMESAVSDPNLSTRFEAAANAIVAYVIRLLQAAADIASPSGLTASEIGQPLVAGIAAGMVDNAGVVSAAAQGVVAAALDTGLSVADFGANVTASAGTCVCEECLKDSTAKIVAAIGELKVLLTPAASGGGGGGGGGGGSKGGGGKGGGKGDDDNQGYTLTFDDGTSKQIYQQYNVLDYNPAGGAASAAQAAADTVANAVDGYTLTLADGTKKVIAEIVETVMEIVPNPDFKPVEVIPITGRSARALDSLAFPSLPLAKQGLAESDLRVNNTVNNQYHLHLAVTPQTAERVEYSFAIMEVMAG